VSIATLKLLEVLASGGEFTFGVDRLQLIAKNRARAARVICFNRD
jgi:hypothetical protein